VAAEGLPLEIRESPAVEQAIDNLVPPDWAESQTDTVVDSFFNYLETGDESSLAITVDLAPLLNGLRGETGRQAVAGVLQSLPVCEGPLPPVSLDPANIQIPSCLPPGFDVGQLAGVVHQALVLSLDAGGPAVVGQGETISFKLLGPPGTPGAEEARQGLLQVRRLYLFARRWSWLVWLVPLGCLFLVLLFGVRSPAGFGHWLGWPMLAAAGITLVIVVAVPFTLGHVFRLFVSPAEMGEAALVARHFVDATFGALSDILLDRIKLQGALMAIAGLFLIGLGVIAGVIFPSRREPRYY
jgi:hypothetical protein